MFQLNVAGKGGEGKCEEDGFERLKCTREASLENDRIIPQIGESRPLINPRTYSYSAWV